MKPEEEEAMPIHDYRCNQCGRVSEILVRVSADEAVRCPECGSEDMERLISASYMVKTDTRAPGGLHAAAGQNAVRHHPVPQGVSVEEDKETTGS